MEENFVEDTSGLAPNFARLAKFDGQGSSEERRELLRTVTGMLERSSKSNADMAAFDSQLAALAPEYSQQVRANLAKLVARNGAIFSCSALLFALDDIEVAHPVLTDSAALTDEGLLRVVAEKSQDHMLAVTQRRAISEQVSHALVEHGNDRVVSALLENGNARIGAKTFEAVAARARDSATLQTPLINRADVPIDLLNDLYMTVEKGLRQEILRRIGNVPPSDIEAAFQQSRKTFTRIHGERPEDMAASSARIDQLERHGELHPPVLIALLREGKAGRTAFKIAFARLVDVSYDLVHRVVEGRDLDSVALLCRGAAFDRALFVSLAINFDGQNRAMAGAEEFAKLYESVPVLAAQRAIRFWKVRDAA